MPTNSDQTIPMPESVVIRENYDYITRNLEPLTPDMHPLDRICSADNLYAAFLEAKKGVDWKESVQRYEMDLLGNLYRTQCAIRTGRYKTKPMVEFVLHERGRTRCIKSQHISDRVVQRSLNDNVLIPLVRPKIIYDNGASIKDRGLDFARDRFRVMLQKSYREYDGVGYILFIDFSKFFDNIDHEKALEQYAALLPSAELEFVRKCFTDFEVDVSQMSDAEFATCMERVFNALEYTKPQGKRAGKKFMRKSVGIGNQISQVTGVLYLHKLDNYCKIVRGIKYYGRYMDDIFIIMPTKEELLALYEDIKVICKDLGVFINEKKTHIEKLTSWNCWLKINYKITETTKVIQKVANSTIRRCRKRLLKHKKLCDKGRLTFEEAAECYHSWRGNYRKYDSGYKIHRLDQLFEELFGRKYYERG